MVEADPKEKGERALLNFGHTLGHAVEKLKGFSLPHGHCVALGCLAACRISAGRGYLSEEELLGVKAVSGGLWAAPWDGRGFRRSGF